MNDKKNEHLNSGFPEWIRGKKCKNCKNDILFEDYEDVGFYLGGSKKGRLFVTYYCSGCEEHSTYEFGDEKKFTLEKLCTLVIQHSKTLSVSEKEMWERRHLG